MIFRNLFAAAALLASLLAVVAPAANAQTSPAAKIETKPQHDARMEWFREAKFGMFIHWGVYSMPADGAGGAYGLVHQVHAVPARAAA